MLGRPGPLARKGTGFHMTAQTVPGQAPPRGRFPHLRRAGDFIYVSGISSRRPDGTFAGARVDAAGRLHLDIVAQTNAVIANIAAIIATQGAELSETVSCTAFLVSMRDFDAYNAVYGNHFDENGPARTTVAVSELPHPFILIEMNAVVYHPSPR